MPIQLSWILDAGDRPIGSIKIYRNNGAGEFDPDPDKLIATPGIGVTAFLDETEDFAQVHGSGYMYLIKHTLEDTEEVFSNYLHISA